MRAAVMVLALSLASVAQAEPPRGFDHVVHDGKIVVSGRDAVACATCHPIAAGGGLIGRPGHAACLGACHPAPRQRRPASADATPVCEACHPPSSLGQRRPAVGYPPYQVDPDFGLAFDHARHRAVDCARCHAAPGDRARPPTPHARCAGCHDGATAAPPMAACVGCHPAGTGVNLRPAAVRGPLALGATYDHRRHQARAPRAAALGCATCHAGVGASPGLELPTPRKAACATAGCHDGAAAFAVTEACVRCHATPPRDSFAVARPTEPFSHVAHDGRAPLPACTTCHRLAPDGQPRAPAHAACAGCHAEDLSARAPRTCGACHRATEPWRHLEADVIPRARSEFGVELSHVAHAAIACERCHALATSTRELRPARGHGACTGAGCHASASAGSARPALDDCGACHGLGREAARDRARIDAPWSVRATFRHGPHAVDGAAALPCATCHADVAAAATVAAIPAPTKAACERCHDGARAFRMTGHGCARCHGR